MTTRFYDQELDETPLQPSRLADAFYRGIRQRSEWMIGAEFEKIALFRRDGRQVPFGGPRGIEAQLRMLSSQAGWSPHFEGDALIALRKGDACVTLEPGGQIELSTAPHRHLRGIQEELDAHMDELESLPQAAEVAWVGIGLSPFTPPEDVVLMPKARYRIMDRYLPERSPHARWMMRSSASIQVTVDYSSEADAARKFLVALSLSPIVNALFANSPLRAGRLSGDVAHRGRIWKGMDPDRSGYLKDVADFDDFSFERWTDYLLDVPMMFYARRDLFREAHGRTFRDYMEKGLEGRYPTMEEWETHQTTVFPEVRLKHFIEIRGADCVPRPLAMAVPALWKGLLYDEQSLEAAFALARRIAPDERERLAETAFSKGLKAHWQGRSLAEHALEILELAHEGLVRLEKGASEPRADEARYLEPAFEVARRACSPGCEIIARWPEFAHAPSALVEALRM